MRVENHLMCPLFFFFNDTATTEIYTLSLHDALPISLEEAHQVYDLAAAREERLRPAELLRAVPYDDHVRGLRSEEHTSELQSRQYLVCRLLLEKKKQSSHKLLMI